MVFGGLFCNPIEEAVLAGDLQRVRVALQKFPTRVNEPDKSKGSSPLHLAASITNVDETVRNIMVRELLSRGADPTLRDNDGRTPYQVAAMRGHDQIMKEMMKADSSLAPGLPANSLYAQLAAPDARRAPAASAPNLGLLAAATAPSAGWQQPPSPPAPHVPQPGASTPGHAAGIAPRTSAQGPAAAADSSRYGYYPMIPSMHPMAASPVATSSPTAAQPGSSLPGQLVGMPAVGIPVQYPAHRLSGHDGSHSDAGAGAHPGGPAAGSAGWHQGAGAGRSPFSSSQGSNPAAPADRSGHGTYYGYAYPQPGGPVTGAPGNGGPAGGGAAAHAPPAASGPVYPVHPSRRQAAAYPQPPPPMQGSPVAAQLGTSQYSGGGYPGVAASGPSTPPPAGHPASSGWSAGELHAPSAPPVRAAPTPEGPMMLQASVILRSHDDLHAAVSAPAAVPAKPSPGGEAQGANYSAAAAAAALAAMAAMQPPAEPAAAPLRNGPPHAHAQTSAPSDTGSPPAVSPTASDAAAGAMQQLSVRPSEQRSSSSASWSVADLHRMDMGHVYTKAQLEAATEGFCKSRIIGSGSFAVVYSGELDGAEVAVKQLKLSEKPDEVVELQQQFLVELKVLTAMHHPNIVALMGSCPEEGLLVYALASEGSLHDHLFSSELQRGVSARARRTPQLNGIASEGQPSAAKTLSWRKCIEIAKDAAWGLAYLHSTKPQPVVHRDIKSQNILLNGQMKAMLGDVGLAKLMDSPGTSQCSAAGAASDVKGTRGFFPPEALQMVVTPAWDIYALGMVMLQMLTNSSEPGLPLRLRIQAAMSSPDTFKKVLAPRWDDVAAAMNFAKLAMRCTQNAFEQRPRAAQLAGELKEQLA